MKAPTPPPFFWDLLLPFLRPCFFLSPPPYLRPLSGVKSHAHGPVVGGGDGEILHLDGGAGPAADVEDGDAGAGAGAGAVAGGEGVDHGAGGLEVQHARVAVLGGEVGDQGAGAQVDLDEVVDGHVGDEAGPRHGRDGGPAGRGLVGQPGRGHGLGQVGQVERRGTEGGVGREDLGAAAAAAVAGGLAQGDRDRDGAEEDGGPRRGGLRVRVADVALHRDREDGNEAGQGLVRVHRVAFDRGDERARVLAEEGGADPVQRARGRVGLSEVERSQGVECPHPAGLVEPGAADARLSARVAYAGEFERVRYGDGGGELCGCQ